MQFLRKLLSLVGLGDDGREGRRRESMDVTLEGAPDRGRDRGPPVSASTDDRSADGADGSTTDDEPVETGAAASEPSGPATATVEVEGAVETEEEGGIGDEPVAGIDDEEGEEEAPGASGGLDAADGDDGADAPDVDPELAGELVESINGIGPSYGERLAAAGVERVEDLLARDPDELAEATGISAKRIAGWIERASDGGA